MVISKSKRIKRAVLEKVMTEEAYIAFEMEREVRLECIIGKLIEMPGGNIFNYGIAPDFLMKSRNHWP